MPAFLAPLLSMFAGGIPWKLIGIAAAAAVVALLWWRLNTVTAERDAAAGRLADYAHAAEQSARAVADLKAEQAKALAAVTSLNEIATIRTAKVVTIKEQIAHESVTSSCGAAVHAALRAIGLQQQPAAAP